MFVSGVDSISSKLKNINLDPFNIRGNMHPKEGSNVCGKSQLPLLHLTPSNNNQSKTDNASPGTNPYLLKPNHDIPATPPPQAKHKSESEFIKRIG